MKKFEDLRNSAKIGEKKGYSTPSLKKFDSINNMTKVKNGTQQDGQSANKNFGVS